MGYIEKWGEGTNRIIKDCQKHGLPEPEFRSENGFFTVTIMKKEAILKQLKQDIQKLYHYIKTRGVVTFRECTEFTGKSEKTTQRYLKKLEKHGLIKRIEKGKYKAI